MAHFVDSSAVGGCIAVGEEMRVARMGRRNATSVPDGAPMLLGASRDFDNPGHQSIGVRAVLTIEALESIEVTQFVPIKKDVIRAPGLRDAIDGKEKAW